MVGRRPALSITPTTSVTLTTSVLRFPGGGHRIALCGSSSPLWDNGGQALPQPSASEMGSLSHVLHPKF